MSIEFTNDSPGVSDVPGFRVGAAGCDIRNKGLDRLDLTLVVADHPCAAAGVFTTNDVKAAPVRFCQQVLAVSAEKIRGIVGNSGNANACTAAQGDADAVAMAKLAAAAVGAPSDAFLVCSTGRIGELLPMAKVAEGIKVSASRLSRDAAEGVRSANAILTSDTRPKSVTARFVWEGKTVTIAGIAKGAGMIEPNMATMLAFVCTDAAASPAELKTALKSASDQSFNCVSVDGDMSTNDTVLLLASGVSGVSVGAASAPSGLRTLFQEALDKVCFALAEKIVGDGEKITKVVSVEIEGARTRADAEKIARAIGNSLLVKSSWYGEDPNWGRLADAAGYARTGLEEAKLDIYYDDIPAVLGGKPLPENKPQWKQVVKAARFAVRLKLNLGDAKFRLLAADLTDGYVNYNKSE
ncbi:MAG: bifunctional ornithine acetyltransferase/N-acetylglutamate synthase [Opitutia bacterium AMD-G1]|nr:MAG: bifunctional ornithine acetyltransferase/N-acetylglutamate synthase [Opitutae bacterium AMD-G1]